MLDHAELPNAEVAPDAVRPVTGAAHRLVRLAGDLILIEVACNAPPPAGTALLTADGEALAPPTACIVLGASRILFAARDPRGLLRPGTACAVERGGRLLATFTLDAAGAFPGDPPVADRPALLRFLAATCAPLLRAGDAPDFAAACHALAAATAEAVARPLCRPGETLSLWSVPPSPAGAWRLIEPTRIRRIGRAVGGIVVIPGPPPARDALLLPPGPHAAPLRLAAATPVLPPLRDLLARAMRGAPGTPALRALLADGPRWTALLREAQLLAPARPIRHADPVSPVGGAIELALADGAGGVFLSGWLRDPLDLVSALELRSPVARRPVPADAIHRVARPDLAEAFARTAFGSGPAAPGFVAHLPDADHPAVAQWRLGLRLASGERITLVAPPARLAPAAARDAVLRAVPPRALRPEVLADAIAPAAWRLHRAATDRAGTPEIIHLGTPPRRPRAALVIPLYRNLGFLRFQIAAFARDAALRSAAEITYVLDSPEQRGEVEHLLRGMSALHGALPLTLLVMPENRGYASACNAGAAASSAPVIGFVNSDVLPAAPGWLEALLRRLARDRRLAAVGPKLLFDDGAIQHAGLLFRRGLDGQWLNDHHFKGFPRHYAPACAARRVPGVTGAALFVRRPAFDAAGGFRTDYIIGDFEDSDLCLTLREAGHEIAYEPAAELFHFERQSIASHAGHARTLAGACNRLLHHRRWDSAIERLMARFPDDA